MALTGVFVAVLFNKISGYADSYGTFDPEGTQCSSPFQSPIDIDLDSLPNCAAHNVSKNEIYLDLEMRDEKLNDFIVYNDGYSVEVVPFIGRYDNPKEITEIRIIHENTESIFSFSNPLNITYPSKSNTRYCFDSLHFHWGSNNSFGSEHTFDNIQTPLEAHLLSFSCDYRDVREALKAFQEQTATDKYIIGVIGVLFDLGEPNAALESILSPNVIDNVRLYDNRSPNVISYNNVRLNITDLVPGYSLDNPDKSLSSLVMYYGSLTTPPCYETIRWFVMKNKLTVSQDQLDQFRRILDRNDINAANNYRELNEINNRTIYNCEYQILDDKYIGDDSTTDISTTSVYVNSTIENTDNDDNISVNNVFEDDRDNDLSMKLIIIISIVCGSILFSLTIIIGCYYKICCRRHKGSTQVSTNDDDNNEAGGMLGRVSVVNPEPTK